MLTAGQYVWEIVFEIWGFCVWAELLSHALLVHCLVKLFVHYLFIQLTETFAFCCLLAFMSFIHCSFPWQMCLCLIWEKALWMKLFGLLVQKDERKPWSFSRIPRSWKSWKVMRKLAKPSKVSHIGIIYFSSYAWLKNILWLEIALFEHYYYNY